MEFGTSKGTVDVTGVVIAMVDFWRRGAYRVSDIRGSAQVCVCGLVRTR